MKNFFIGFVSASIVWFVLIGFMDIPEYIVYDCADISWYSDAPEDVRMFCAHKNMIKRNQT